MLIVQGARWIVILFGVFLIIVGFVMLLDPQKARETIRKAGSTNMINYAEITIRMIPAAGLILSADLSKYPDIFSLFGWFMLITSVVLYVVPRKLHHAYAVWCADILKPGYMRLASPFSMFFGIALIHAVI